MSDKSEKTLVWGEAVAILIVLVLVFAPHVTFTENHLLHLFSEKLFDIALALFGTLLGYWLAKRHIEHLMAEIVKTLDTKYLNLFRERAFHRAVSEMLTELPDFSVRPTKAFSSRVADAISEFTHWSAALDPTHTPEKSIELIAQEAYTLAVGLIEKDLGFKEAPSTPNYEWIFEVQGLPVGWAVEEPPDLSIYNWDTGAPAYRHARMEELTRTATSVRYSWKWDMKNVLCGLYVGIVNFKIGGQLHTGMKIGERLRVFLKDEGDRVSKNFESVPWE